MAITRRVGAVGGSAMRADPLVRRAIMVVIAVVVVTTIFNVVQGRTSGDDNATNGYRIVALPAQQLVATGNCPDARAIAGRAALFAAMAVHARADLRLTPTTGCAAGAQEAQHYRARVRAADLTLTLSAQDWASADTSLRRQVVIGEARSLQMFYPAARVTVRVAAGRRTVMRAGGTGARGKTWVRDAGT